MGEFLVQCVNPFMEPVELPAGSLVGKFHSVQEEDVGPAMETAEEVRGVPEMSILICIELYETPIFSY